MEKSPIWYTNHWFPPLETWRRVSFVEFRTFDMRRRPFAPPWVLVELFDFHQLTPSVGHSESSIFQKLSTTVVSDGEALPKFSGAQNRWFFAWFFGDFVKSILRNPWFPRETIDSYYSLNMLESYSTSSVSMAPITKSKKAMLPLLPPPLRQQLMAREIVLVFY